MTADIIKRVTKDVSVIDSGSYRIAGRSHPFAKHIATIDDRSAWYSAAGHALSQAIYQVHYLGRAMKGTDGERPRPVSARENAQFGRILREANTGTGWWDDDWSCVGRGGDRWMVRKRGITLHASSAQLLSDGAIRIGDSLSVRFPKHLPYMSPGFYCAVANAGPARRQIQRLYFNVRADNAAALFADVVTFLNQRGLKALVKVVNDPAEFGRPDACTLYLERTDLMTHHGELAELLRGHSLDRPVPGFCFRWMCGVGFAEEPQQPRGTVVSFGEHRSRIFGRAIARAFVEGDEPCAAVDHDLRTHGLDPARIYLNSGTRDVFLMVGD